jgi:hypothetical protein
VNAVFFGEKDCILKLPYHQRRQYSWIFKSKPLQKQAWVNRSSRLQKAVKLTFVLRAARGSMWSTRILDARVLRNQRSPDTDNPAPKLPFPFLLD